MGHQLGTTCHRCFASLTPVHFLVSEWWLGFFTATPCWSYIAVNWPLILILSPQPQPKICPSQPLLNLWISCLGGGTSLRTQQSPLFPTSEGPMMVLEMLLFIHTLHTLLPWGCELHQQYLKCPSSLLLHQTPWLTWMDESLLVNMFVWTVLVLLTGTL